MRKLRIRDAQIVGILYKFAAGAKASKLFRKYGMSDAAL